MAILRRPSNFIPAGNVTSAQLANSAPSFISKRKPVGARAVGLRYEGKVHAALTERHGAQYLASPWFVFRSDNGPRWCQPDGLLLDVCAGTILVIEVKHSITDRAWWWLQELYIPVVRKAFGANWNVYSCTIVKWFDSKVVLPAKPVLCKTILQARPGQNAITIWNPKFSGEL